MSHSEVSNQAEGPLAIDGETAHFAFQRKNPMMSEGAIFDGASGGMERTEKIS
ncbi:hypothetical protein [Rhizobium sp. NPDC090279]|uniref:hypothetical protein n=1 Tax=Rhizobium sp. NPDC090279 TaxID=3364499 RepID=UPI00383B9964